MRWSVSPSDLRRRWRDQARSHRLVVTAAAVALTVALFTGTAVAVGLTADPDTPPVGVAVPPDEAVLITAAAGSCPSLTPPRLAGQLMASSGLSTTARRGAHQGIAGLTDEQWRRWAPGPTADRANVGDTITALAHQMCDLVGAARLLQLPGDPWRVALAMYWVGPAAVTTARAIPPGEAATYVSTVDAYTAWYERQALGGSAPPVASTPAPSATAAAPRPPAPPVSPASSSSTRSTPARAGSSPAAGTRSAYRRIEAESYAHQAGTGLEPCQDTGGGRDVGYVAAGDWLEYARVDFGATGATRFAVRHAGALPPGMTGTVQLRLDSRTAAPVAQVTVADTSGWQTWSTATARLTRVTGVHDVYLTFLSSNGWEIGNLNWIEFAP